MNTPVKIKLPHTQNIKSIIIIIAIWTFGAFGKYISAIIDRLQGINTELPERPHILILLFGVLILITVLNSLIGKEVITIDTKNLTHSDGFYPFIKSRTFKLSKIEDLEVQKGEYLDVIFKNSPRLLAWGPKVGRVCFTYNKKTYRIAGGIDEAKGREIIRLINSMKGP